MMKKLLIFTCIFICSLFFGQIGMKNKDYKNIMKSTNIFEINAFLRDAHPQDSRRAILKPKVMEMMQEYIRKALPFDQKVELIQEMLATLKKKPSTKITFEEMTQIIRNKQRVKILKEMEELNQGGFKQYASADYEYGNSGSSIDAVAGMSKYQNPEKAEFDELMNATESEQKSKTVDLLNSLFNNDETSKEVIVNINNESNCNIIVRIEGIGGLKYRLPVAAKKDNNIVVPKGSYLFSSLVCGAQYAEQKKLQKGMSLTFNNPNK